MAKGRTISWSYLTKQDIKALNICREISNAIAESSDSQEFSKKYGKVHDSRDGGLGLGSGKLQRDALCTRGRQGKAPYSNRNFRWHPLIVADSDVEFAQPIERLEIESDTLAFIVNENGTEKSYSSDEVWALPCRYVILPEHWAPHIDALRKWEDITWTQNSCVIAAQEACSWQDAVVSYAVLGISAAVSFYAVEFSIVHNAIKNIINSYKIDSSQILPSDVDSYTLCPVCKKKIAETLENFRKTERRSTWQPSWRTSKQNEGEDGSIQILHINPLVETEIRHKPNNVRFGHRWCNVAMSDHSLEETLDFMTHVVRAHAQNCEKK